MCDSECLFFFKQKTAYEMRISDWSSDVCSSDLFARFISRPPLLSALRRRSWQKFAAAYNGPGYASNRYDEKLEESYARFKAAAEAEAPAAARNARGKRAKADEELIAPPPGREDQTGKRERRAQVSQIV